MLYDSVVFIGRDEFPDDPIDGQLVHLKKPFGDFNKGLYYWNGEEWSDGVGSRGIDSKDSVIAASNGDSYMRFGPMVIDKVQVLPGDRVLLKNQDDPRDNGIYIVQEGDWTRPPDANSDRNITAGMYTYVEKGENLEGSSWILRASDDGSDLVFGESAYNFAMFSGEGMINVGVGLVRTGDSIALSEMSGLVAGSYQRVTVDRFGRVSQGSNPTTLAGHGITDAQERITGAASTVTDKNLISGRLIISSAQGKLTESDITTERLDEISAAISGFDAALNIKQDKVTGAATTIVEANLERDRILISNDIGKVAASETSVDDLTNISGTRSNIQEQIDTKFDKTGGEVTGHIKQEEAPVAPQDLVNRRYVDEQVSMVAPMPRSIFSSVPGEIVTFSGGVRWYPPFPVIFSNVRCFVNTASTVQPIKIDVVLNGTESLFGDGPKPTIPIQEHDSGDNVIERRLDTSDFITLSVLSGGGKDLSVRIDYIANRTIAEETV